MNEQATDSLLAKMIRARRFSLLAYAAAVVFVAIAEVPPAVWPALASAAIVLGMLACLVIAYYVYRVGRRERGLGYAAGHVLLCLALLPLLSLLIPFLVCRDIERWRQTDDQLPNPSQGNLP
jgi:hypothetical protein